MIPRALGCYANAPARVRARAFARWATAPFGPVEARLPATGRILDVGCGIGVFACHVALASTGRAVVGVDSELDDIALARLAARHAGPQGGRVDFRLTPPGDVPDGPWDAVVLLLDLLARLDAGEKAGLIGSCAEQLSLGGLLVANVRAQSGEAVAGWMEQANLVVRQEPLSGRFGRFHLLTGARRRSVT
ncbi:MAG: methyltransferase domain-containing protein [Acidimicrobiales bacterium]